MLFFPEPVDDLRPQKRVLTCCFCARCKVRDEDLVTYCGMASEEVAVFRSAVDAVNALADGEDSGGEEQEFAGEEDEEGGEYLDEDEGAFGDDGEDSGGFDGEHGDAGGNGAGRAAAEVAYSRGTPVEEDVYGYEDELEVAEDDASYEDEAALASR